MALTANEPAEHFHPQTPAELVIIDPQNIFASPDSEWGSPMFPQALEQIRRLAPGFGCRVTITRWLPVAGAERTGTSWTDYFEHFAFADVPAEDELYDLVPGITELAAQLGRPLVEEPTFGKWGQQLAGRLDAEAGAPHLVLTGVSTDCCVLSTALSAVDAGCWVTVIADACAGSTEENHRLALNVMALYEPQLRIRTTAQWLGLE